MKDFLFFRNLLLLLASFSFLISCSPRYGAHFSPKAFESNDYATKDQKDVHEDATVSTVSDQVTQKAVIEEEDIMLVETIEPAEDKVIDQEEVENKRGVLRLVEKKDKNAKMTAREEMILDALQIRLKEMSKEEKVVFKKEVTQVAKEINAAKLSGDSILSPEGLEETDTNTLLLVILAVLLPPLAVGLHEGALNGTFWLNLLLTLLFYVPGLIHALIVILR